MPCTASYYSGNVPRKVRYRLVSMVGFCFMANDFKLIFIHKNGICLGYIINSHVLTNANKYAATILPFGYKH